MSTKIPLTNPGHPSTYTASVLGSFSLLLTAEFWVHLLVPYLREHLRFPPWPTGEVVDLVLAAVLAGLAARHGSQIWWLGVVGAIMTLGFMFFMLGG